MMKITGIRFSFAKAKAYPGDTIGFFSVQFDNSLIIHRFMLKRVEANGYHKVQNMPGYKTKPNGLQDLSGVQCPEIKREEVRLTLPRLGVKPHKHSREMPVIFISDKELINELRDKSYRMYKYIIDNYDGMYEHKSNGAHEMPLDIIDN